MKTLIRLLVWGLFCLPNLLFSQQTHQVRIEATQQGTAFKFRVPNPPKLTPFTKNQPYLSYFWDFGDGTFKRGTINAEEPVHTYAKAGDYTVRALIFTGNTLDLVEQPKAISVHASASGRGESLSQSAALAVIGSHYRDELRPTEDMMAVFSTKGSGRVGGKLYVFFNEKQHKGVKPLEFRKASAYFGEREGADNQSLPDIATAKGLFNDVKVFDLLPTDPSVMSSLFLTFQQVSNINNKIKNLKVRTYALWVVDGKVVEKANLILNVVPSHDPNDMRVDPAYLSFRGARKQDFTYRVRFENTDKGIAKSVGVKIFKPKQADTSRIEWLEFSPKCEECPKDKPLEQIPFRCYVRSNTAEFSDMYFHNAQLAGKTKGMLDKSLNDGFVTYKLHPVQRGLKKLPLASHAVVTFDGQEQKTNTAKVNFTRGMWFGLKIGANYDPLSKNTNFFVGATLSPYREVRPYLQFEVMMDVNKLARQDFYMGDSTRTQVSNQICQECYRDTLKQITDNVKQSALNFVPLQVRWDLSKVLSIGAGTSMDVYFRKVESSEQIITRIVTNGTCSKDKLYGDPIHTSKDETKFKFAAFGDIQVGIDQFKLGARYVYPFDAVKKIDYMQFFVTYKF
jgi:PKD repeat protein